jgi:hypothetical protein
MTRYAFQFVALLLLAVGANSRCLAWGANGHRIIGALAQQYLTASTQAAVSEILQGDDLVMASTWADEMRSSTDNVEFWTQRSSPWHYVNIRAGESYATSEKHPMGDALMAIETFSAILQDKPIPQGPVREGLEFHFGDLQSREQEVKAFSLRFLIHILGDLQQPLHSGYDGDRGGNDVTLRWFGETTNLHTLWDSLLVAHAGLSYSEYAQRLSSRLSRMPASDIRGMERGDPDLWAQEAQHLLGGIYAGHRGNTELGYDYAARFTPTVELQLVKGGVRTAHFLNSLFGGWSDEAP